MKAINFTQYKPAKNLQLEDKPVPEPHLSKVLMRAIEVKKWRKRFTHVASAQIAVNLLLANHLPGKLAV